MRVARGSASLLPSHGRGIWPRDVLKEVSRGLSRVEAGNPGFPRLVQVTSGGFSRWLGEARETGGGRGLLGLHWAWCIGRGPHLQLRQEPQATSDFRLRSRSEEHTSELQSPLNLVCRLLLEKKKNTNKQTSQQQEKETTKRQKQRETQN